MPLVGWAERSEAQLSGTVMVSSKIGFVVRSLSTLPPCPSASRRGGRD